MRYSKTDRNPCVSQGKSFTYYPNPELFRLNREAPDVPYRFKPGGVIAVEVNRDSSYAETLS